MTKIDKHISELLFDHDCVIVPELGGFLASYDHARIHPTQHTFAPPSKKIAFNIFLKQNDGLLANHVSKAEQLSYNEAMKMIERFVTLCNDDLSAGKKIIIERVGTLYFDVEKNLQFEPLRNLNYLLDSFGLSAIQSLPVKHVNFDQRVEKQLKEFIGTRPSVRGKSNSTSLSKKAKQKLQSALILSGALLWFSFNLYVVSPNKFSLTSLNPFSISKVENSIPAEVKSTYSQPSVKAETVFAASAFPFVPETTNVFPEENKSSEISSHDLSNNSGEKFFVVAGVFRSDSNAAMFFRSIKQEGFASARLIYSDHDLKMVCYEGFSSRGEALSELARLKALQKEGWVYSR